MNSSPVCKRVLTQAQNNFSFNRQPQPATSGKGFVFNYFPQQQQQQQQADESGSDENCSQVSFTNEPHNPPTTPNLSSSNNSSVSASASPLSFCSKTTTTTTSRVGKLYVTPASSFSPTSSVDVSESATTSASSMAVNPSLDSRASLGSFDLNSVHSSRVSEYSAAPSISTSSVSSPSTAYNAHPQQSSFFSTMLPKFNSSYRFSGAVATTNNYDYVDSSCYELIRLRNRQLHHDASFMTNDSNQSKSNDITVIERTILENKNSGSDGHHESYNYNMLGDSAHSSAKKEEAMGNQFEPTFNNSSFQGLKSSLSTPIFNAASQGYSFFSQPAITIPTSTQTKRQASYLEQDSVYDEEDQVVVYNDEGSLSDESSPVSNCIQDDDEAEKRDSDDMDILLNALKRNKRQRLDTSDSQNLPFTPPVKLTNSVPEQPAFKFLTKLTANLPPVSIPPLPQVAAEPPSIPIAVHRRLFDADFKPAPPAFHFNPSLMANPKPFNFEVQSYGETLSMVNCHSSPNVQQQTPFDMRKTLSYNSPGSVFNSPNVLNNSSSEMNRNLSLASSFTSNNTSSLTNASESHDESQDEDQQILDEFIEEMLPLSIKNQQAAEAAATEPCPMPARTMLTKIDEAEDETSLNSSSHDKSASHGRPNPAPKKSKFIVQMTKTARLRLNKLKQSKMASGPVSRPSSSTSHSTTTAPGASGGGGGGVRRLPLK